MRQSGCSFEWRQCDQKWLFSTSCLFTEDPDENIRTHNMIDHLLVALQMTRTRRNSTEPLASCTLPPKKGGAPGNYWKSLALTSRGVIPSRRLWLTIDIDEPKIVKKIYRNRVQNYCRFSNQLSYHEFWIEKLTFLGSNSEILSTIMAFNVDF